MPARCVGTGAEGIGLCRTEHMFFGDERLAAAQSALEGASGSLTVDK